MTKDDIKIHKLIKLKRPLCGFDVETTGLNPIEDRIIQVGVVICHPDGTVKEGVKLVNPEIEIPKDSIKIHGISNEELKDQQTWKDVGLEISNGMKNMDICAYNGTFDLNFVKASCKRENIPFEAGLLVDPCVIFKNEVKHTLSSAVKYYLTSRNSSVNLGTNGAHDALWDARASLIVLQSQLEMYPNLPRNIEGLHKELFHTVPEGFLDVDRKFKLIDGKPHVVFGKWGRPPTPFNKVPRDYFEWMMKTDFSESTKKAITNYVFK